EGPGLVQFEAIYGPGATIDAAAETNASFWPTNITIISRTNDMWVTNSFSRANDAWLTNVWPTNAEVVTRWGLERWNTNGPHRQFPGGNTMRGRQTDLQIPTNEIPALDSVIAELNLKGKSRQEVLDTLSEFFSTKFTYRMWQDADNDETPAASPLSRFLLKTRAGHCEYFATATVLLLRELGIPARYAVGYSVHEAQWSGYVVRQSDAHAWCLVWDDKRKMWDDFDTTPGNGVEEHHSRASLWFANAWWWAH